MPNDELNFDQLERLVDLRRQLQSTVDQVCPGYKVTLTKNGASAALKLHGELETRQLKFGDLTHMDQIDSVLTRTGGTVRLRELFDLLRNQGSTMSFQSLMSNLSAGKKSGRFRSFGRGIWGMPQYIVGASEMFDNLEEKK